MKQYHQYRMQFNSKGVLYSSVCMGISLFLSVLYYLAVNSLDTFSGGILVTQLWLPLILGIAYLVLLRGVRYNAPGLYAIIGVFFCLLYILGSFGSGSFAQVLVALLCWTVCAAALVVVMGGFFPSRLPASLLFGIAIGLRVLLFDLGRLSLVEWLGEAPHLFSMAAFLLLPLGLKERARRWE